MASTRTITVPTGLDAAQRLPEPVRVAALALAAFGLEAVLALGLVEPRFLRLVVLFVAVFAIAFVFRFPLATALIFIALTDFVFHATFFDFELGPLNVRPQELALAGLLVLSLLRPQRHSWGGVPGAALAVFLAVVSLSGALAILDGRAALSDVFNWSRPLGLLTFFYVVVRLFPSPEQRRTLLTGAVVLAAATGPIALAVALGAGFGDSLQAANESTVLSQESLGSIERVRLVGLSAAYALFWYTVVRVAGARGVNRLSWFLLLAGIGVNIAVSFNRNMWLGLLVGMLLMGIGGGAVVRNRLAATMGVAVAGVVLILAFGGSNTSSALIDPVVQRGASILDPSGISRERSFQDRSRETELAWDEAKENLSLGVGAGAEFNVFIVEQIGPHSFLVTPKLFLHNQYIYLLLIGGIPGLVAFLVFLGAPVAKSFRRRPTDPAIAACGVGIALIMISSVVAIYFTVGDMTVVLGMLTGTIVADAESRVPDGQESGLVA